MNRIWIACVASTIALGSMSAFAADLTPDEGAELRQRADELKRVRDQNPVSAQDGMKLDRPQGDVKVPKPRGEVKAKPKSKPKSKSKNESVTKKMKRSAETMPGALVRKK